MKPLKDFLGHDLNVGDFIVYPVGSRPPVMVLAQIVSMDREVKVRRFQEGSRRAGSNYNWGCPDPSKEFALKVLEKLTKVPQPDWTKAYDEAT